MTKITPLGDDGEALGTVKRLHGPSGVGEAVAMNGLHMRHRLGIVDGDVRAAGEQLFEQVERRSIANIVGPRLEGQPPDGDPTAGELATEVGNDLFAEHLLLCGIRLVHGGEDPVCHALVAGHRGEGLHVLGKAAAAVAHPRKEKRKTDPLVVPDPAADVVDVGLHSLAEVGHLVDEADLRGQERVGDILRHLGTLR